MNCENAWRLCFTAIAAGLMVTAFFMTGGITGMDDAPIDQSELLKKLEELRAEHRTLDAAVIALHETGVADQLKIARMKKRKLILRDEIAWIEDQLNPDIIA